MDWQLLKWIGLTAFFVIGFALSVISLFI